MVFPMLSTFSWLVTFSGVFEIIENLVWCPPPLQFRALNVTPQELLWGLFRRPICGKVDNKGGWCLEAVGKLIKGEGHAEEYHCFGTRFVCLRNGL